MTGNTQYKTLVNEWLKCKRPMIAASTYANFVLISENHLKPYFGKRKINLITESEIQRFILHLHLKGRTDGKGGLKLKTIRDIILVLRLSLVFAYKEKLIQPLNWELIEYPKDTENRKNRFPFKRRGTGTDSAHLSETEPQDSRNSNRPYDRS